MTIRPAEETDIPEIISLLRASLGESFLPKSERYWHWKHVNNPFGTSPVLLAEENCAIIGVRAFMRWQWNNGNQSIKAVRAVDTATHPSFQGRGIFSKLTKALLNTCERNQWNLVFNTPNEKSMPGYLKMGWKRAGRLPIQFKIIEPFSIAARLLNGKENVVASVDDNSLDYYLRHDSLQDLLDSHVKLISAMYRTEYSAQYLRWRYMDVPVAQYYGAGVTSGNELTSLLIYRLKPIRWGIELRVTDLFIKSLDDLKKIRRLMNERIKLHRANIVTFAGHKNMNLLNGLLSGTSRTQGPIVTVRDILPEQVSYFMNFKTWSPTLGDMELF